MRISENVIDLEPSATMAVAALALELRARGRDIIDLSAGEPDFRTPEFIAEAGIAAIANGQTRYTPPAGLPRLREAIAGSLERRYGRAMDPRGVVVTAGAKQALFNACFVLFGPGDRVLVPAPYWTSYPELIKLARAEPVIIRAREERGLKLGPDELESAYDERVRGLILNSPSNPTGAVYTRDELEAIVRWAAEREVWVLSDEIYSRIHFNGDAPAPGLLDLDPALLERAVVIDGASKAFAMTGWRIGFSYSAPALASHMAALQSHTTSNAAAPSQHAAIAAYSAEPLEEEAIAKMVEVFRQRRDLLVELFRERLPGMSYIRPDGAFYLFFRADAHYTGAMADSVAFCREMLDRVGVALVPGAAFGDDRYVRLSFAASEAALERGVARIADALGR
ncbi:MAG TPA: pyridoxal phosphate-dependent aminotransferase [Longimicrobiales bacterium]